MMYMCFFFFFSSRRRHTRCLSDWSSDVCSSDLERKSVFAVCSGLIEYINEPSVFLKRFQSYASNILISYNPSAGGNRELVIRFGREWISHFSPEQSEQFFG